MALLQAQSVDFATVESTVGPFLGPYRMAVDLVASVDDAAMAEAYMVGMVVPQEQPEEQDNTSGDIEALFGDSSDSDATMPGTPDEQVALLASFETAPRAGHALVHGCRAGGSCGHARGAHQRGEGGGTCGHSGGGRARQRKKRR
jgi:hypothetical protein